jgi:hypothetical protein
MSPCDDAHDDTPDELELLRLEARRLGMPGSIDAASVGISLTTPEVILARAKGAGPGADDSAPPASLEQRRRPRPKLALRAAAAVAAAVVVILAVGLAPWHQGAADAITPPVLDYEFANAGNIAYAPGKDARAALLALADAAEKQPQTRPAGSTQLVVSDNWFASLEEGKAAQLIPKQRSSWLRKDASVSVREISGKPLSPDGRVPPVDRGTTGSRVVDETYPAEDGQDAQYVAKLGGDTDRVRDTLMTTQECEVRVVSPSRARCLYNKITDLFSYSVVPPQTTAAFWRILADEPSIRLLGSVEDRAGRSGVGISLIPKDAPQFRLVMIISAETGQLLGTEDILIKDDPTAGVEAPAIYSFTAILEARYTRATGPRG